MAGIFGAFSRGGNTDRGMIAKRMQDAARGDSSQTDALLQFGTSFIGGAGPAANYKPPMISSDGRYALLLFGELYLPSGSRLQQTNFEREFLLPYLVSPTDYLRNVEGGFTLAVMSNDRCIIANDAFGNFPLHYIATNDLFAFSTQMLPLRSLTKQNGLDDRGLLEHLGLSQSLSGRTMFEGVKRLPRGTWMSASADGLKTDEYISRTFHPSGDVKANLSRVHDALSESVQRAALLEDATVALTGGFDSRMTCSLIAENDLTHLIVASTHGVPNARDILVAQRVARKLNMGHDILRFDQDIVKKLPVYWEELVRLTEGQLPLSQVHSYYACSELKEKYSVLIDSFGGALFRRQIKKRIEPRIDSKKDIASQVLPHELTALATSTLLRKESKEAISQTALQGLQEYYTTIEDVMEVGDKFDLYYADETASLRDCFSASLQMNFIGVSQPLLSQKAFDILRSLPGSVRRREGIHKYVIHRAAPRLEHLWLDYSGYPAPYVGFSKFRLVAPALEILLRKGERILPTLQNFTLRRAPITLDQILRPGLAKASEILLSPNPDYDRLVDRAEIEKSLRRFEQSSQDAAPLIQLLTFRMFLDLL
jgi:asparagine synthetase B (glutamine-hydrolysing)